jgi:subtilisin family serine protease
MAAAGNQVGFVVSPANYGEVIAVAASNIEDRPWRGSSHGRAVDVTAPGESVHVARAKKGSGGANDYSTGLGSGTSFAVALTAGVAALWLDRHGRNALITKYGKANLQAVFADTLRRTTRRPRGWRTSDYGTGIVNADALLAAALPDTVPTLASGATPAQALTATERLASYLPDQSALTAAGALDTLLGDQPDRDLYAGEIAYHMSQDPTITAAVAAAATPRTSTAGTGLEPTQRRFALERLRRAASPSLSRLLT